MLLIQVEKVLAIQTGTVLGRKAFLWPIAALLFTDSFDFSVCTGPYYKNTIAVVLHVAGQLDNPVLQSCFTGSSVNVILPRATGTSASEAPHVLL